MATRAEVTAHLATWYDAPLADAGIVATDTPGGLKEILDEALRAMGTVDASLAAAAPTDGAGFRALAEYHAMRRVVRKLQPRFNLAPGGGENYSLRQAFENAMILLREAEARVILRFGTVNGLDTSTKFGVLIPVAEQSVVTVQAV